MAGMGVSARSRSPDLQSPVPVQRCSAVRAGPAGGSACGCPTGGTDPPPTPPRPQGGSRALRIASAATCSGPSLNWTLAVIQLIKWSHLMTVGGQSRKSHHSGGCLDGLTAYLAPFPCWQIGQPFSSGWAVWLACRVQRAATQRSTAVGPQIGWQTMAQNSRVQSTAELALLQ